MSALTCEFCGRVSIHMDGWRQIFSRSMTRHDDEKTYMICPKCHKLIIEDKACVEPDPDVELDSIRDKLEEEDPGRPFIGMSLRDFLCSDMYLRTQNIMFQDRKKQPISDYTNQLDLVIIAVDRPDKNRVIYVTLGDKPNTKEKKK